MPDFEENERYQRLVRLDIAIAAVTSADKGSLKLAKLFGQRSSLRVLLGSAEEGLRDAVHAYAIYVGKFDFDSSESVPELITAYDAMRAAADKSIKWSPHAALGEALRVYARDVLLSSTPQQKQEENLVRYTLLAVDAFEQALAVCDVLPAEPKVPVEPGSKPAQPSATQRELRAWLLAHRAACFAMLYWMRLAAVDNPSDPLCKVLFDKADKGFTLSLEEAPGKIWPLQFKAFLLALRGNGRGVAQSSDPRRARNLLARAKEVAPNEQSSLLRSKAMLFSYDVAGESSPTDRYEAAVKSIDAAFQTLELDPDDPIVSYFAAVSSWHIANDVEQEDAVRERHKQNLPAAIRSAAVRARNVLSQALAALSGLELLEAICGLEPTFEFSATELLGEEEFQADWETRAMFLRDPLSRSIHHKAPTGALFLSDAKSQAKWKDQWTDLDAKRQELYKSRFMIDASFLTADKLDALLDDDERGYLKAVTGPAPKKPRAAPAKAPRRKADPVPKRTTQAKKKKVKS